MQQQENDRQGQYWDLLSEKQKSLISEGEQLIEVTRPMLTAYLIAPWPLLGCFILVNTIVLAIQPHNLLAVATLLVLVLSVFVLLIRQIHPAPIRKPFYFVALGVVGLLGSQFAFGSLPWGEIVTGLAIFNGIGFLHRLLKWLTTRLIITDLQVISIEWRGLIPRTEMFKRDIFQSVTFTQDPLFERAFGIGDLTIERIGMTPVHIEDVPHVIQVANELKSKIRGGTR